MTLTPLEREALLKKASLCLEIAQAILPWSDEDTQETIAVDLMNLPEASLDRIHCALLQEIEGLEERRPPNDDQPKPVDRTSN